MHTNVCSLNYEDHKSIFEYDSYAEVGFWKLNLEKLGGYEVSESYIDYEILQKKWALENNSPFTREWLKEILEHQIEAFKPDVIYEDDAAYLNPIWRKALKKKFPFIKRFIAWDGYIKSDVSRFEGCDLILTCVEIIRQKYLNRQFKCEVLPFGFEPAILDRMSRAGSYQTTFVGNIIPEIHSYRLRTLYNIYKSSDIEVWISNFSDRASDWKRRLNYYRQARISDWNKIYAFERRNRGEAFGLRMYNIFHDSFVTLNIHGDGVKEAGNMRLIEACGSGACLLTDYKPNISDYFIPDEEIVVFKSEAEAAEKILALSNDEGLRNAIAQKGQEKVLKHFSFLIRASRFQEFLQAVL